MFSNRLTRVSSLVTALPRQIIKAALWSAAALPPTFAFSADLPNPVMFVTQVPSTGGFADVGSVFANHLGSMQSVARGGDLWIRYPNGTLRNLTEEAGYGSSGLQGANAIAVRDPAVNFAGNKAVFSMIVGAPTQIYQQITSYWQLYEITGFGVGQTITITKVAGQPGDNHNVQPTYGSDGAIIFASDRTRGGERHLYPQLDEYESTPTPSGLWKLQPSTGKLSLLQHSPSGSFSPFVDSYGRIIFTRWDHLQQDQQAESSANGAFNWASEAANAPTSAAVEVFPEPRSDTNTSFGHRLNNFLPWMINQDGTGEETLNHIGRHELFGYFSRSLKNDSSLRDFSDSSTPRRANPNVTENWLQIAEDPTKPGRYVAIDAPEFYTAASGQIISIEGGPSMNAADMKVTYLTPRSTHSFHEGTPPADFSGHYRHPLPMSDGSMLASWVSEPSYASNIGTRANPNSRYKFRLYKLSTSGSFLRAEAANALTTGISKNLSWYDPDVLVTYNGPLWEISPVEVRARATPPMTSMATVESPEAQAFTAAGVNMASFKAFLAERGLGVVISRNVTTRDAADTQQPYNLRVPGGVQTTGTTGAVHDISYLQFLQADAIRGLGGSPSNARGRRELAQPLHDASALQLMPPAPAAAPAGAVQIASDGSIAAIVPALRATTWQTTTNDGTPVVRERFWVTVQPGEIRACGGCHAANKNDQAGNASATNMPLAFKNLLTYWQANHAGDGETAIFKNGFD